MDWKEFFLVQAGIAAIAAFGILALHASGRRHSRVVDAIDQNPLGHLVLMFMGMSKLRHQDEIERIAAGKLPSLMSGLDKTRRGLAFVLAGILFFVAGLFEFMYLVETFL